MNRVFLLAVLLITTATSYAEVSFNDLSSVTTAPDNLEGHFVQEKYLAELDASLESSGVFNYQRGKSIRWATLQPIETVMLMTPESIITKQGQKELNRLDIDSNAAVAMLNDIFFSVLTAEWDQLASYFSVSGTLQDKQWQVTLVPIDKTVMQIVSKVELTGDDLLRDIIFFEKNGDRTTIHFDELSQ